MVRDLDPEKILDEIFDETAGPIEGLVKDQLTSAAKLAREELERRHGGLEEPGKPGKPGKPEEWPKSGVLSEAKTAEELGITEPEFTPEEMARQAAMRRVIQEDSED
jgi:hypothetical protein